MANGLVVSVVTGTNDYSVSTIGSVCSSNATEVCSLVVSVTVANGSVKVVLIVNCTDSIGSPSSVFVYDSFEVDEQVPTSNVRDFYCLQTNVCIVIFVDPSSLGDFIKANSSDVGATDLVFVSVKVPLDPVVLVKVFVVEDKAACVRTCMAN